MAETKDQIAADRDRLAAENTALRAQLAAAGRPPGVTPAQHTFQLSQGDLMELERNGWVSLGGKVMTVDDVREALVGTPQEGMEIADADPLSAAPVPPEPTNLRGFDYVYPSVSRGEIDPKVAGTPGISGPAATVKDAGTPLEIADAEPAPTMFGPNAE